jgi:predicted patatin/cPLA2 family phospholipase
VVIRTVPSQMYYTPQWFKRMERWLGDSSLQPLVNIAKQHETTYGAMQRFIEKPPGKLRIFEIYPPKPLLSMALGSRVPALHGLQNGRLCGRYFLATVGKCWRSNRRFIAINALLRRLRLSPTTP